MSSIHGKIVELKKKVKDLEVESEGFKAELDVVMTAKEELEWTYPELCA